MNEPRWTLTPGLHCIHVGHGLCPACLDDYLEDPDAWREYGQHTAGEAAWEALQAEIAAEVVDLTALDGLDDTVEF